MSTLSLKFVQFVIDKNATATIIFSTRTCGHQNIQTQRGFKLFILKSRWTVCLFRKIYWCILLCWHVYKWFIQQIWWNAFLDERYKLLKLAADADMKFDTLSTHMITAFFPVCMKFTTRTFWSCFACSSLVFVQKQAPVSVSAAPCFCVWLHPYVFTQKKLCF